MAKTRRLYLLRHGDVAVEERERFTGWTDVPLAPEGRRRVEAWQDRFAGFRDGDVWSSDLTRAVDTAAVLLGRSPKPEHRLAALREIHLGEWEECSREEIRRDQPEAWQARGEDLAGFRPPGGESFGDLERRVLPAMQEIAVRSGPETLVVTHAGVIRVLLRHALDIPPGRMFRLVLDYGSLTILELSEKADAAGRGWGMAVRGVNLPPPG